MHRQILCVIGVFFILFKIELCQELAGFRHVVIHSSVLQNAIRSVHLKHKLSA